MLCAIVLGPLLAGFHVAEENNEVFNFMYILLCSGLKLGKIVGKEKAKNEPGEAIMLT